MQKIDEQNIENRIVIDRSEAENHEFMHETCVFFITFFQPNTLRTVNNWFQDNEQYN